MEDFHLKGFLTSFGILHVVVIVLLVLILTDVLGGNVYSRDMDQHVDRDSTVRFKKVLVDKSGKLSNRTSKGENRSNTSNDSIFHVIKDGTSHEAMLRLENQSTGKVGIDFVNKGDVFNLGLEHNSAKPVMKLTLPKTTSDAAFQIHDSSGNKLFKIDGAGTHTFHGDTSGYDAVWQRGNNRLLFNDNAALAFGTGADFNVTHNATNTIFDSTSTTAAVYFDLGTDTQATEFAVRNNSGTELLSVAADGGVSTAHDGVHNTRYKLLWTGGERGKPGVNGDIISATEALNVIADPHFELLGTNAVSGSSAIYAEGGITLTTAGADGDQVILVPHLDASQSGWGTVTWGTDKSVVWECMITSGANITNTVIWAGLKLTNTSVTATDAEQVFFRYEDDVISGDWQAIDSIAGTDTATDTDLAVVVSTKYHLKISIDSSRIAKMYINGTLYKTTAALTSGDLIPYIGVEADGAAAAKAIHVHYQSISRTFG